MSMHHNQTRTGDMGLSLTGMRIGPRDPTTQAPKVGTKLEVIRTENSAHVYQQRILKDRTGFSGGFKILEETRKSKIKKKGLFDHLDQDEDADHHSSVNQGGQSLISKDEIFQQLNLGPSDSGMGVGKSGMSKNAIAKDLVEGLQKEIDKLKRQQENIQLRKHLALTGQSFVEETQEEREQEERARLRSELENAGTFVIAASPQKLQVMRHQASQLASLKNIDIGELEKMRTENEERMKQLETMYFNKRETGQVGMKILERMGKAPTAHMDATADFDRAEDEEIGGKKKRKKSVKIASNEKENLDEGNEDARVPRHRDSGIRSSIPKPILTHDRPSISRGRSPSAKSRPRSAVSKKRDSPDGSPRQSLYEAKFEKYLANKEQKHKQEKKLHKLKKEDFEIYMRGPESPSKKSQRFSASKNKSGNKYDSESLLPANYDQQLILKKQEEDQQRGFASNSKDPFKRLGVSNEDKMTFFLLKWIFNAIKRDSQLEDNKLKGKSYITKIDLVKQLSKNDELMNALGYEGPDVVTRAVKQAQCAKDGCLTWEEFLDFFFLRQADLSGGAPPLGGEFWWRRYLKMAEEDAQKPEEQAKKDSPVRKSNVPRYGATSQDNAHHGYHYEDPDKKPVKMTESLKMLQDTRRGKVTVEVEEEFKALHQQKMAQKSLAVASNPGGVKKKQAWESTDMDDENDENIQEQFGFKREKSECKLLQSQIAIMQEIFETLDKFNDGILRRQQFIMALRCDERIVEFIDVDAVKVPYSKRVLALDEVFVEIEKDEMYETAQLGKQANQINHKEFITWREFMTYFNDYREIEERNKKAKEIQKTREKIQKERKTGQEDGASDDESNNITSLMEKEKQRRLTELPKLRPADQIDISEKQLQLLKDLYDGLPRVPGKDCVYTIEFFIATRKNPQLRSISSAIARDPEGYSRIPRETFQQVFDRLEADATGKEMEWTTIVEYFTKRGRPLTKEEIHKLIDEDRKQREDEEMRKRADEEAERRRIARLMEDLENDQQDFDAAFDQQQQQSNGAAEVNKRINFEDEDRDEYDNEYDEEEEEGDEDDISREGGNGYTSDPEVGTAKRSYNFHGDAGDNSRRNRAQSAKSRNKSFNEGNLRSAKLTTQDYADHRSNSKKGKYGVTVPRPFNFDMREKTRKKTIREKKIDEMVAEKRIEEENIIKHQFRPKPIPPEVLIPRYKTIQEANDMRRLEVKKNSVAITKATERPFSFYERDKARKQLDQEEYLPYDLKKPNFKANPIPRACSVLIFDQMIKKQEQERQERIRKQAELNFSKARLPERMQMHSEKQKQLPPKRPEVDQQYTFQPKINDLVTKEQFKKAQDKFNSKLQKKKSQQSVTRPRSPNFQKTSTKGLEREYLNEREAVLRNSTTMDKFKTALMKKVNGGGTATSFNAAEAGDKAGAQNPSSTKSMTHLMSRRREELEDKRKQNEMKEKEDQERFDKQNRMKNTVQAALRDRIKDDTSKRQAQLKEAKEKQRKEEEDNKKAIQECVNRARQRPLLIESVYTKKHNENLAKIKATKAFVEILKEQNLNPKDHLNDEQLELLAEADFVDRRKKELLKQ